MNSLTIKNLTVAYHNTLVLQLICAQMKGGTLTAVVGPNGAGKSTLLKAIVRLVPWVSGTVLINEKSYNPASGLIAYVPQRAAIEWTFPFSVLDFVLMGSYGRLGFFRRPGVQEYKQAYQALDDVDLLSLKDEHIGILSGGQQQRLLIARALMQHAALYLLDEPIAGVDQCAELLIFAILKRLRAQGNIIMMVHHNISHVQEHFDHVLLLNRVCLGYGPVSCLQDSALLQATYQGIFS